MIDFLTSTKSLNLVWLVQLIIDVFLHGFFQKADNFLC